MKINTIQILFLCFTFLEVHECYSQLEAYEINGQGWIKGNFIEAGINRRGVFGAFNANRPSSFHENREYNENDLFGFIANPQADGWMDYDGDFFTTGNPEESFGIHMNGENHNNYNTFENIQEIPGEIISVNIFSSDCFEDTAQIIWEGNIEGLSIKRYFSITENGLFIQIHTFLKNLSSDTKRNVYFMHNVDPDNNASLSSTFETDMHIISQANSNVNDLSLVTASQPPLNIPEDMDGSYVSFYSKNANAKVSYGGFENRNAYNIWNGIGVTITEGSITNFIDKAISISFNLGDLDPGETTKFTYYYVLKEIDEGFVPLIFNLLPENPSLCEVDDGKIIFTGLVSGDSYTVSYTSNGTPVSPQVFVADTNGEFEIQNLSEGHYSDFYVNYNGCDNIINIEIDLIGPTPANFILLKSDITNCENSNGEITISGLSPSMPYNYSYSYNGQLIGPISTTSSNNGEIILNSLNSGNYYDFVIEQYNCETLSSELVTINEPANQTAQIDTSTSLFIRNNTYEIIIPFQGEFLYSIDGGPFQVSNVFQNITSGLHNFLIVDTNGCTIAQYEKYFVNYLSFFTPNNDGINDYWQLIGVEYLNQPKIFIFDRYGKLLKQLDPFSIGWDGSYEGHLLPSSDYWFKINFSDAQGVVHEFISHFTLKL